MERAALFPRLHDELGECFEHGCHALWTTQRLGHLLVDRGGCGRSLMLPGGASYTFRWAGKAFRAPMIRNPLSGLGGYDSQYPMLVQ